MEFRRKPIDSQVERKILHLMICSDQFLKSISPIIKTELLRLSYGRLIAKWCIEYQSKYDKAPKEVLSEIFNYECEKGAVGDEAPLIGTVIKNALDSYEGERNENIQYELDKAKFYLRKRSIEEWKNEVEGRLAVDDLDSAEASVFNYKSIVAPEARGVNLFSDLEGFRDAIEGIEKDVILKIPGVLGSLVGNLYRDDLFVIEAPRGRGKSYFLLQLLLWAVTLYGRKVLLVSLEMTTNQYRKRLAQMVLGESVFPGDYRVPYFNCVHVRECRREEKTPDICIYCRGTDYFVPVVEEKTVHKNGLNVNKVLSKVEAIHKTIRGGELRFLFLPSKSASVHDLDNMIKNMEYYDGFVPSIIAIDHPNRFKHIGGQKEGRFGISNTWETLVGINQRLHTLMIAVTHTKRETLKRNVEEGDVSEDINIENLANEILALNQLQEEKEKGIIRATMTKLRDGAYNSKNDRMVLYAPDIGCPILDCY